MRRNSVIITAAAALLVTAAWAQREGGTAPGPTPGGRPSMPTNMMRRLPFAAGTVQAIDMAAGTVTLAGLFSQGKPQTVKVTAATKITAQTAATVADLQIGEALLVRGVPTGITASQITDSADGDGIGRLPGGPPEERVSASGAQPGGGRGLWTGGPPAIAQATGKITRLSPLTISVTPDVSVTLKAAPDLKVTRTVTEKIGDLKVGDRIMATGQSDADGNFTADQIRVNGYGSRRLSD